MQTSLVNGQRYGLTMAAIEQVAQQGLACVTHMSIEVPITLLSLFIIVIFCIIRGVHVMLN